MMPETGPRSAVLLLRVWQDERGGDPRGRLLQAGGRDLELRTVATASGVDAIVTAVAGWLEGFVAAR
jgi:hypothetical protein